MELSKGTCLFCPNTQVISESKSNVLRKLKSLFKESSYEEKLDFINPPKVCPVCYHKINLLRALCKDISTSRGIVNDDNCCLCRTDRDVINVSNWKLFDKISNDFSVLTSTPSPNVCSACCFYLDTRNCVQEKLLSRYPKLKIDSKKRSSKFESSITVHSTPNVESKRSKKKASELVDLTFEDSNIDLDLKVKPLKQKKDIVLPKVVGEDKRFMNEVLVIDLLNLNLSLDFEKVGKTHEINKIETTLKHQKNTGLKNIEQKNVSCRENNDKIDEDKPKNRKDGNSKLRTKIKKPVNFECEANETTEENKPKGENADNIEEVDLEDVQKNNKNDKAKRKKQIKTNLVQGNEDNSDGDNPEVDTEDKERSEEEKLKDKSEEVVNNEKKPMRRRESFFKIKFSKKKEKTAKKIIPKLKNLNVIDSCRDFKRELMVRLENLNLPLLNGPIETEVTDSEDILDRKETKDTDSEDNFDKNETEVIDTDDIFDRLRLETSTNEIRNKKDKPVEQMDVDEGEKLHTADEDLETADEDLETADEGLETADEGLETADEIEIADSRHNIATPADKEKTAVDDKNADTVVAVDESVKSDYDEDKMETTCETDNEESIIKKPKNNEKLSDQNGCSEDENEVIESENSLDLEKSTKKKDKDKNDKHNEDEENIQNDSNSKDQENISTDKNEDSETVDLDTNKRNESGDLETEDKDKCNNESQVEELSVEADKENQEKVNDQTNESTDETSHEHSTDVCEEDKDLSQDDTENSNVESQGNTTDKDTDASVEKEESDPSDEVITLSDLEKEQEENGVEMETLNLNSSTDSRDNVDVDTGKRKRSDSTTDTNGQERKKKKVTFSEDVKE